MYDIRKFTDNLRSIIEKRGINQKWLASEVNSTEATISRYVNGERLPKIDVLVEIASALHITMDELLGLEPPYAPKIEPDVKILTSCYKQATVEDRKVLWALLDKYMTADERIIVSAHEDVEKSDAV